jgi:hypothetical protein
MNGKTSGLDTHIWKKYWTLIMVQVVRKIQIIFQFKSLKLREKLRGEGFGDNIILKYFLSVKLMRIFTGSS